LAVRAAPGRCLVRAQYRDHHRVGYEIGFLDKSAVSAFRRLCAEADVTCV
jgi:hypothetical protein